MVIYPVDLNGGGGNAANQDATILHRHKGPTCSVAACPQKSRPWLMVSASYDGSAVVWASEAQYDCVCRIS